jgi:uncharacterized membrane protein YcaP (DUF421 family)
MKKEDIHFGDWARFFMGETPAAFLIEIIIRMAVIYLILIISMRIMGKRMAGQLSLVETTALVSLAAAVGVPLLDPARGLLPSVIIAGIVVSISYLISKIAYRNPKFESIAQAKIETLVNNSTLDIKALFSTGITRERILGELRSHGIKHLGEVKRLYIEANGDFTLIKEKEKKPGLSIIPEWDIEFIAETTKNKDVVVCKNCGCPKESKDSPASCENCDHRQFVSAID